MEKIIELLNDKNFTAGLTKAGSAEEVKAMFEAKGADISAEQFQALKKVLSGELSDDELGAAAAGSSLSELSGRSKDELYRLLLSVEQSRWSL